MNTNNLLLQLKNVHKLSEIKSLHLFQLFEIVESVLVVNMLIRIYQEGLEVSLPYIFPKMIPQDHTRRNNRLVI